MAIAAAERVAELLPGNPAPITGEAEMADSAYAATSTPVAPKKVGILDYPLPPRTNNMTILFHWYERHYSLPRQEVVDLAEQHTRDKINKWQPVDHLAEWVAAEDQIRHNHSDEIFRDFLRSFNPNHTHLSPSAALTIRAGRLPS